MALTLSHSDFKKVIDEALGFETKSVYIPADVTYPAACYAMTDLERSKQSGFGSTTISEATYSVFIAARKFQEAHDLAQTLVDKLDSYSDANFLGISVVGVSDDYEPEKALYIKSLVFSTKFKE